MSGIGRVVTRTGRLEAARLRYETAFRLLRQNDLREQAMWESAPTPWDALDWYMSDWEKERRLPLIKEWRESLDALEALRTKGGN